MDTLFLVLSLNEWSQVTWPLWRFFTVLLLLVDLDPDKMVQERTSVRKLMQLLNKQKFWLGTFPFFMRDGGNWRIAPVVYDDPPVNFKLFGVGPFVSKIIVVAFPPPPPPPSKKKKKERNNRDREKGWRKYEKWLLLVLNCHKQRTDGHGHVVFNWFVNTVARKFYILVG